MIECLSRIKLGDFPPGKESVGALENLYLYWLAG